MHRGLGGAVVGDLGHGDEGEAGGDHDDAGGLWAPGDQVGEEVRDDVDGGEVVGRYFIVDRGQGDRGGVGEVDGLLEARVEEDTVKAGVRGDHPARGLLLGRELEQDQGDDTCVTLTGRTF